MGYQSNYQADNTQRTKKLNIEQADRVCQICLNLNAKLRKIIYTTNSIENFNRGLRKVTKSKAVFPTDDSLLKMLYLAMTDIKKKWTGKSWEWGQTLDQLCIFFGDRIQPEDII